MLPLPPPTPPDTYRQMRPQTHRRHILLRRATPPSSSRETADRSADRSASCRSRRRSRRGQQWRSRGSRSRRRRRSRLRLRQRLILRRSVHGALRRASECVHTGDDVSDVVWSLCDSLMSPSRALEVDVIHMYMHVCAYVYGCMQYTCVYVDIYTHVYTCMNIYIYISQRCTPIHSYHYSHTLVYRVVYALSDIQVYNVVYIYV